MKQRIGAGIALLVIAAGCSRPAPEKRGAAPANRKVRLGFSMDTLKEERWHRDRDLLVRRAGELGAEVLVQAANGNDALQNSQAENMLTQGVDVLLVAPHNGRTAAVIVEAAHRAGVPVIAYDRLINDADVDLYMSFDNERVGQMQAEYLVTRRPRGNYVVIGGAPTDNNALLYHQGQMKVLEPYVSRGEIRIVADQWARDWLAVEALKIMENALTRSDNKVDAVVAANDGVAGGAIQALAEQGLAGRTLVSGQDAELSACQRVAAGTQTMTVYKPIARLASKAAEVAVKLALKQPHGETTRGVSNGKKEIPSILQPPIAVDRDNLVSTVIADGYQKLEDVYREVPRDRWPKKP
jgi:D-xylose transport system substrate-binding protein